MSSRNAYLSKFLFTKALEPMPFKFKDRGISNLCFTPQKKNEKFYGSVTKQSHVIFDYRDTFKNAHDELVKEVAEFVKTGKISGFAELFQAHVKRTKIKSLTIDKIKEIHAANLMLFSKLAEEVNEYLLLEEINKI